MRAYLICRTHQTRAGIRVEDLGLILHAPSARDAVDRAKALGLFAGLRNLVAIPQDN